MAYCEVTDLLIGDIPTSVALDPAKYVADAADEIDSKIGFVYETPVVSTQRPVTLLLKRINSHLASGRLILAATIPAEMAELNSYGSNLVNDAMLALDAIAKRMLILVGAPFADGTIASLTTANHPTTPLIANVDAQSDVEAFAAVADPVALVLRKRYAVDGVYIPSDGGYYYGGWTP